MSSLNIENVEKLFSMKCSEEILKRALKSLMLKKDYLKTYLVLFLLCLVLSIGISVSEDTVILSCAMVGDFLNIFLAMFGIVFTGYAFFQALINKPLLIMMLNSEGIIHGESVSKFQEVNELFVELMIQYILGILLSLFLKIALSSIPNEFTMFSDRILNNFCAGVLLLLYLFLMALILWRMISFLFNVFQLFNAHAGAKALEIVKEEKEK